jgi:hypothetical protein
LISSCLLSVSKLLCKRSSNASPIATNRTLGSACNAWLAAPVPRPPQPTNPTRSVSPGDTPFCAWARPANAPAMTHADEDLRKARREKPEEFMADL